MAKLKRHKTITWLQKDDDIDCHSYTSQKHQGMGTFYWTNNVPFKMLGYTGYVVGFNEILIC